MRRFPLVALTGLLVSACLGAPDDPSSAPRILLVVGEPAPAGERPRGLYFVTNEPASRPLSQALLAPKGRVLYLNYDGGVFTPGGNDSRSNRSSIPSSTSSLAPWGTASQRATVTECVRELFAPFDFDVVTDEPTSGDYIESVVAGYPQNLGLPSGVGGVSPFNCDVIERSIVFTFAGIYGSATRAICETAVQEVAHSFGLDHQYLCEDPMTYLSGCGPKQFRDVASRCGEYNPRDCQCGGATQNSYQMLLAALGPAGPPNVPPTVSIAAPGNGATVDAGFTVRVSASDDVAVTRVELRVVGVLKATLSSPPYEYVTDATLAPGRHSIEARAFDATDAAVALVTVTVRDAAPDPDPGDAGDPDPGDPTDPADPEDSATGETGDACERNEDCATRMCLTDGTDNYCSRACDPAAPDSCPVGLDCTTSTDQGQGVCWPGAGAGGDDLPEGPTADLLGGCAAAGHPGAGSGAAWLGLVLLGLLAPTRRRRGITAPWRTTRSPR